VENNRGVALILALLVLSFLTVLGGALLTTSTIDIRISDNYKSSAQTLYLAEAGIDDARELLRTSGQTLSQLLITAAGPDGQLSSADDRPLIASRLLNSGHYEVWLKNDSADGVTSMIDRNEAVTLISVAAIGATQKTVEASVIKGKFPDAPSDPRLSSTSGLESLAASIVRNATDLYPAGAAVHDFGSAADYRVAVASGNADLGPGSGYGILLVRGQLNVVGNITWNGLILVIGQGVVRWNPGVSGMINGGLFVAATQDSSGMLLATPAGVSFTITDTAQIGSANQRFPYNPISIRER
jgi:Tfp pilus assembly protein PilX